MEYSIIAAIGKNNELGKDNKLIFRDKRDMQFFKETTLGNNVIMGRKTYESIGRPLPKRENFVLTHNTNLILPGVYIFNDLESLTNYLLLEDKENFIIGGAKIYEQFLPYSDKLYLTEIDKEEKDADAFFPDFNKDKFDKELLDEYVEEGTKYKHVLYRRK